MKQRAKLLYGLMIICSLLLTSCASITTTLTAVWNDNSFSGSVRKIAVIGMFKSPTFMSTFEDEFSRQLKERGIEAVAGSTILPVDEQEENEIMSKLRSAGVDYVLITRFSYKVRVPTRLGGRPPYYLLNYYGWGLVDENAYPGGFIVEDVYALAATKVYDVKHDKLIWSVRSATEISRMNPEVTRSFVRLMIDRLTADGVVR